MKHTKNLLLTASLSALFASSVALANAPEQNDDILTHQQRQVVEEAERLGRCLAVHAHENDAPVRAGLAGMISTVQQPDHEAIAFMTLVGEEAGYTVGMLDALQSQGNNTSEYLVSIKSSNNCKIDETISELTLQQ
ncbi:hypothetical protein [Agarivorans sp. Toyoura001]|uniref:hypothetical protein n=1 Tax=unclassified Agarivorans TaxID=2636026 RepID=UPI0010E2ACF5|nr:hypothetical protein [Agarivorans sp. Toyoura001]GDY25014.1 hypothetical protein AHAT_09040 [Agarivorans sp. Toyoura001]